MKKYNVKNYVRYKEDIKRVIKFSDKENEIIPNTAISKKYDTIFFGPLLSNK